ncbi:hypothetical protein L345_04461, partial [Ophiophagus hannah]
MGLPCLLAPFSARQTTTSIFPSQSNERRRGAGRQKKNKQTPKGDKPARLGLAIDRALKGSFTPPVSWRAGKRRAERGREARRTTGIYTANRPEGRKPACLKETTTAPAPLGPAEAAQKDKAPLRAPGDGGGLAIPPSLRFSLARSRHFWYHVTRRAPFPPDRDRSFPFSLLLSSALVFFTTFFNSEMRGLQFPECRISEFQGKTKDNWGSPQTHRLKMLRLRNAVLHTPVGRGADPFRSRLSIDKPALDSKCERLARLRLASFFSLSSSDWPALHFAPPFPPGTRTHPPIHLQGQTMALPHQQRAWSTGPDQVPSASVVRGLRKVFTEKGRRAGLNWCWRRRRRRLTWVSSAKALEKAGVEVDPSVKLAAHLENGKRLRRNATSSMVMPGFTHYTELETRVSEQVDLRRMEWHARTRKTDQGKSMRQHETSQKAWQCGY